MDQSRTLYPLNHNAKSYYKYLTLPYLPTLVVSRRAATNHVVRGSHSCNFVSSYINFITISLSQLIIYLGPS